MPKTVKKTIKKKTKKILKKKIVVSKKSKNKKKIIKKTKKIVKKKNTRKKIVKKDKKKLSHKLKRFVGNPIIYPTGHAFWESRATFNPTAFEHNGKIHILYRAIGMGDVSTICYGESKDGYNVSGRTFKPIFVHYHHTVDKTGPIISSSGGGWNGGAEDPHVTKLEDRIYMTYTAFDGWGSMRIGLTSISLEDFLNKKWNWNKPVLISPPEQHNKNWVIFPEKINGKFAILHDLWPAVSVFYVDRLEDLSEGKYKVPKYWSRTWYPALPKSWVVINSGTDGDRSVDPEKLKENVWTGDFKDIWVRATGPAPIKTKHGWLVFYHAVEAKDPGKFKVFAMLLDYKNPTKILHRSKEPVLEPETFYEMGGIRPGIVYSCGAVVKDRNLFVYYGGADMVSCVATADFELFLKELISTGITKLKTKKKN